ncbi:LysR family transcriptional regulator [Vibrio cholerae]|uniref:LysR family transcriptional regulator n=1 Tax=Vibrio TaxID=662 RepID=UPI00021AA115|nr:MULTISPECIES: LysR family transcriptional regulator [Vibrio]EGQ9411905.1 LysR family transcriptional regulator [Vibrio cholerae]EGR0488308.1 LysR family transcriptional regulator [Vibrio cholerae]EGR0500309.1 LysR family transcriptional regulator [Vibrio cholerae]EGR0586645.1 LysR family transcriptional regulator [Vibrio cholerae]EGR0664650.1 LysR family transcriptional regulator [Vibrio cholerae]
MHKHYRYFLMVAHLGNIKQAAERLHITQPSLTAAIKKLENDIGFTLFHRRSKGVELTEYGQLLKEHVQEQQEQHSHLLHRLQDMQQREKGKLKLGTGDAWWELFVRDALNQYLQDVEASSIHLEFGNNLALMHHLVQSEIDLFIGHEVYGLSDRCKVKFIPLLQDKEAIYVRSGHPLLSGKTQTELDVAQAAYPVIRVTPDHPRHRSVLAEQHISKMDTVFAQDVGRQIYHVDSLAASLDILRCTDAVMPYSSKLCQWMEAHGAKTLVINTKQVGNVGIYCTAKLGDNDKVSRMIDFLKKSCELSESS